MRASKISSCSDQSIDQILYFKLIVVKGKKLVGFFSKDLMC